MKCILSIFLLRWPESSITAALRCGACVSLEPNGECPLDQLMNEQTAELHTGIPASVALVVIYNHRYDQNIERIEKLYGCRFDKIFHLVPFYDGQRANVIAVYENSHCFQGYIAQGRKAFQQEQFQHYLFIGDDLILNPAIDQANYREHFHLKAQQSFIPGFFALHDTVWWKHVLSAFNFSRKVEGIEVDGQLPDRKLALEAFARNGLALRPLHLEQIWHRPGTVREWARKLRWDPGYFVRSAKNMVRQQEFHLPYPMVGSYSDILIVDAFSLDRFCHCCGVFAASKLFAELAIPTALVLSAENIVTEKELALKGKALWVEQDHVILERYQHDLGALLSDFPEGTLYVHPVKLSKWKMPAIES